MLFNLIAGVLQRSFTCSLVLLQCCRMCVRVCVYRVSKALPVLSTNRAEYGMIFGDTHCSSRFFSVLACDAMVFSYLQFSARFFMLRQFNSGVSMLVHCFSRSWRCPCVFSVLHASSIGSMPLGARAAIFSVCQFASVL